MENLNRLELDILDRLLISFDDEVTALDSNTRKSCRSVDDKFYMSIGTEEDSFATLATNMIRQNNDFVFDKTYVNPLFLRQNTTATLLDTIRNEEDVQSRRDDVDEEMTDQFTDARKKMDCFLSRQRSQRREEKLKEFKSAIAEYRWLYRPKLISPFLKTFLQECRVAEYVLSKFVQTVHANGREAASADEGRNNAFDCIFGMQLQDFLVDKRKQQYFNRLFLPGVYKFPKQLNTVYVFNKYIHQFFPNNVEIADGTDTIHSLFLNTVKFKNVDGSQTVSNFVKSFARERTDEECNSDVDQAVRRLRKVQRMTVLYLIMKSRLPDLKLKRAERGKVSSITNEFVIKANTMYYNERLDLWCIYSTTEARPTYSYDIMNMFHHVLASENKIS